MRIWSLKYGTIFTNVRQREELPELNASIPILTFADEAKGR